MEVVIATDPDHAAVLGADVVEEQLRRKPASTLGLATGSSPLGLYGELIRRYTSGQITFAEARAVLLDEYVGLATDHPQTYRSFIEAELTGHIDLRDSELSSPDGRTEGLASAGDRYEKLISELGGVDLQILGIGSDGHIGFNEPTSSLGSRTRVKTLTEATRRDNSRFFDNDLDLVPQHVLTQGIATILDARHLLLIACGEAKTDPVRRMIEGPLTAMLPASALQLHPRATIILDEASAADLQTADYHRDTYANRPSWQKS